MATLIFAASWEEELLDADISFSMRSQRNGIDWLPIGAMLEPR